MNLLCRFDCFFIMLFLWFLFSNCCGRSKSVVGCMVGCLYRIRASNLRRGRLIKKGIVFIILVVKGIILGGEFYYKDMIVLIYYI